MGNIAINLGEISKNTDLRKCTLIAVSKYVEPKDIIEAYNAGIINFGENKVQNAERKRKELPVEVESEIKWHFIGHLQTNKVKKVVGNYEFIHSVDSIKLAKAISEEAKKMNIEQKILLQVNVSNEESKFGFESKEFIENFSEFIKLENIKVEGLMTMAPFSEDTAFVRVVFRGLRELRDSLEQKYQIKLPELSMGMSNDYKIALEEGATMIRLGSVLFK